MQKVSRTMLAVVAAIQSGTHTRRKPKYIKEQALVSGLYPMHNLEQVQNLVAKVSSVSNALFFPREEDGQSENSSSVSITMTGKMTTSKKNKNLIDTYNTAGAIESAVFTVEGTREVSYIEETPDIFTSKASLEFTSFNKYDVNFINQTYNDSYFNGQGIEITRFSKE
ncbi:hypothetical protein [Pseudoalteromonas tetraodonis]|uniref:hypothetical protein n=1 Tax=Pseudoalteromonas tetraodonis TaxID=43659 RepID=UPI003A980CD6